jgi:predicted Zn-dependent protease
VKFLLIAVTSLWVGTLLGGCQPSRSDGPTASPQVTAEEKTGNGGFTDDGAYKVIKLASSGTAHMVSNFSNQQILMTYFKTKFGRAPDHFDKDNLSKIIGSVHLDYVDRKYREGRELMFDYGQDEKGPYIVALKPFFLMYSDWKSGEVPEAYVESASQKLIHEAGHLYGLDDDQSDQFSQDLNAMLLDDEIKCSGAPSDVKVSFWKYYQVKGSYISQAAGSKAPGPIRITLDSSALLAKAIASDPTDPWATKWTMEATVNGAFEKTFDGSELFVNIQQKLQTREIVNIKVKISMSENFLDGTGTVTSPSFKTDGQLKSCYHVGLKEALTGIKEKSPDFWGGL